MRHNMEEREGTGREERTRSSAGHSRGRKAGERQWMEPATLRAAFIPLLASHQSKQAGGDPPRPERGLRFSTAPSHGDAEGRGAAAGASGRPHLRSVAAAPPHIRGEGTRRPPAPQPGNQATSLPLAGRRRGRTELTAARATQRADPPLCSLSSSGLSPATLPPPGEAMAGKAAPNGGKSEDRLPACLSSRLPSTLHLPCGSTVRLLPVYGPLPASPRVGGPDAVTGERTPRAPPQSRLLPLPLPEPSPQAVAPAPGRSALFSREPQPRPGAGRRRRPRTCEGRPQLRSAPRRPWHGTAAGPRSTLIPGGRPRYRGTHGGALKGLAAGAPPRASLYPEAAAAAACLARGAAHRGPAGRETDPERWEDTESGLWDT